MGKSLRRIFSEKIQVRTFIARFLSPERVFISGFAAVILLGAFILWLPFAVSEARLSFVDALFTSTSAVCVTGLATIDLGKDLSMAGQIVTIFLFQIGGLGIITFSTVFFVLMGRGISVKGREIVQSSFLHTPRRDLLTILKSVLGFTLVFETLGVLLLYIPFSRDYSPGWAFYHAVYNSISAFNNCGYSLFADSLMRYQGDWVVNFTIVGLLVCGGIGFVVQYEVFSRLRGRQKRLSLHTKMALVTTAVLLVGGAILFYLFEKDFILRDAPIQNQFLASIFQSASPRTCGYNTVDIGALTNPAILLIMILMFIGASPGSTGGGVKTTSAALIFLLVWNRFRGREEVNVCNRTIPKEIITRTIFIIFASAFSVSVITSLLLLATGDYLPPFQSRHHFVEYLFESVSAFGTVGLSMNLTPKLNDIQKIAITILMFAGRVGPLTLAFSLSRRALKKTLTYAEEGIMVG
jgi:trk system potassium uptake protein TrkH